MDVITIESDAFAQIMAKLKSLEDKFLELRNKAENPLRDRWLDNQEIMELLKISKRTLQKYRDGRVIPYSKVGSKIYYKAGDVEKFLKKNYNKSSRF